MTNTPDLPADLFEQKRFGRILDIITDSVSDDIDALTEELLAEADAPAPPDPNDNEAYDAWYDNVLRPMQDKVWELIADSFTSTD